VTTSPDPGPSGAAPRGVAQRVVAVLFAFGRNDTSLTLSEIARRTGLPTSTVLRILKELVAARVLERTEDNRYAVGLRLFEVGMRAPMQRVLRELAVPVMEDLYEVTHENVHLGVLDATTVLVIQQVTGRRSVQTPARSGGRLPAYATANGKALLAFAPGDVVEAVIEAGLRPQTRYTVRSADRLLAQLADVRTAGYAVCREENSLGTVSVGAPVLDEQGRSIAALSVVFRSTREDVDSFGPAMRTAAMTLGRLWRERKVASLPPP
jgi:DNA-binding IclR family transcriptional regulator